MFRQFDSMLITAMRLVSGDAGARAAAWRQIVDIVAQAGPLLADETRENAFGQLAVLRDGVPIAERRMAAASLAGRTSDPAVLMLFARDLPAVAAPFLARADLTDAHWRQVIPVIPAAARNILRNRRDLPVAATDTLGFFTAADLTLPPSGVVAIAQDNSAPAVTQIRDLVDRIAAYRQRVPLPLPLPLPVADAPLIRDADSTVPADAFAFETTIDGTIDWIEGAAREAIIGMTIAEAARLGNAGVDGQASGAWRRRAPIEDARMVVGGRGGAGGNWLISAVPLFNPLDGRFCGYRGSARRPRVDEHLGGQSAVGRVEPDTLRQIVHELRTPLNAIQGFAEMIDRQMLGPATMRYREHARSIMVEAGRLVAMVDDLDTSARLETGRMPVETLGDGDIVAMAARVCAPHRLVLEARGVGLVTLGLDLDLPAIAGSPLVERTMARLLSAVSAVATTGERLVAKVESTANRVVFSVSRPAALAGRADAELLDPGYGPDGDWPDAPLLGLGFTLRLVARLSAEAGGAFTTYADRFALSLPVVAMQAEVRPA